MNIKLPTGISLSLFLFCTSVFAEQLQVGSVYTDHPDEISFAITLPPGLDLDPKPADFQLLDGTRVIQHADEIVPFSESNRKLALLLCIDVSGSINKALLKETQDALINIFSGTLPKDRYKFGLVSFADKVVVPADFTEDPDALSKSIRELTISRGKKTRLYQAIIDSLNKLSSLQPAEYSRILIISDGKDEGSIETADSVINLSKALGIPIDTIGRGIIPQQYADGLSGLAKATGGRFIYPRAESLSLKEAVIRLNNSFIENTWIVYFRYKPDTGKRKLENAAVKFIKNDTLSLSANISASIPAPQDISYGTTTIQNGSGGYFQNIDKEKLKQLLTYLGFGLLVLATLIFIVWVYRRRNKPTIVNQTLIKKTPVLMETDIFKQPDIKDIPPKESKRRETVVSSITNVPPLRQDSPSFLLVVTEGPLKGHKHPIGKAFFRIGANQDNDLVLVDEFVSGKHALLTYDNGELLLTDLNSRNGTYLNGELLQDKTIAVFPGDIIGIGESSLSVMEL